MSLLSIAPASPEKSMPRRNFVTGTAATALAALFNNGCTKPTSPPKANQPRTLAKVKPDFIENQSRISIENLKSLDDKNFDQTIKAIITELAAKNKFFEQLNRAVQKKSYEFAKTTSNSEKVKSILKNTNFPFNAITVSKPEDRFVIFDLDKIAYAGPQYSVGSRDTLNLNYPEGFMLNILNEAVHVIRDDPMRSTDKTISLGKYCYDRCFEENLSDLPALIFTYNDPHSANRFQQENILSNPKLDLETILYFILKVALRNVAPRITDSQILAFKKEFPKANPEEIKQAESDIFDHLVNLIVNNCLTLKHLGKLEDSLIELGVIRSKVNIDTNHFEYAKGRVLERFPGTEKFRI